MPVTCDLRDGKWRVVEGKKGKITTNRGGTAVDGGGHETESKCMKQARAINASTSQNEAKKIDGLRSLFDGI